MSRKLKISLVLGLVALLSVLNRLEAAAVGLEEAFGQLDASVLTNLDLSALPPLTGLDAAQLQAVCRELQTRLQGEYVVKLAPLREVVTALLPLLDHQEDLRPYAAWLRARLDYLAVADELSIEIPALTPGLKPTPRRLNPDADAERSAWRKRLLTEDWPNGARLYVEQLKAVFRAEGVPPEMVWLAEVESEFDPSARSPIGAVGLFQLMPETAELLGLSLKPRDQRLDPEKNARGSARYLKYLYDKFGDWRVTLAAYNAGEGLVRRLLEKERASTYDEIAVQLPAETQMYVPKVEATILRREGVALSDLKQPKGG